MVRSKLLSDTNMMFDRIAQRSIREISMVRVRNIHANTYTLNVILDDISRLLISRDGTYYR